MSARTLDRSGRRRVPITSFSSLKNDSAAASNAVPVLAAFQHAGDRGGLAAVQVGGVVAAGVGPDGGGHATAPFGAAAISSSEMSPTRSVSR